MDASNILYGSPKEKLLEKAKPFDVHMLAQIKAAQYLAKINPDRYRLEHTGQRIELYDLKPEPHPLRGDEPRGERGYTIFSLYFHMYGDYGTSPTKGQ